MDKIWIAFIFISKPILNSVIGISDLSQRLFIFYFGVSEMSELWRFVGTVLSKQKGSTPI